MLYTIYTQFVICIYIYIHKISEQTIEDQENEKVLTDHG